MTRKDYERAAKLLLTLDPRERASACDYFCEFFNDQPNFNRARFLKACGFSEQLKPTFVELSELALNWETTFTLSPKGELVSSPLKASYANACRLNLESHGFNCYSERDKPGKLVRVYVKLED